MGRGVQGQRSPRKMHNIVAITRESVSCDPKGEGPRSHLRGAEAFGLISDWESTSLSGRRPAAYNTLTSPSCSPSSCWGCPLRGHNWKPKGTTPVQRAHPGQVAPSSQQKVKGGKDRTCKGKLKIARTGTHSWHLCCKWQPFIWKTKPTCYFLVILQLSCSGLTTHSWSPSIFSIPGVCVVDGACPVHASLPMGLWVLWARTHHLFLYLQHLHQMWEYFCTQKIRSGRNEWGNHLR